MLVAHKPLLIPATLLPPQPGHSCGWGRLIGASAALAAAELAAKIDAPLLVLADDPRQADQLESEIRFFSANEVDVHHFVEWETLPWDSFSPHQDIISERLSVLAMLNDMRSGIVVASAPVLLQRLPPVDYVAARSLSLATGQTLPRSAFIDALSSAGYLRVPQVSEHGEFAVRGSLIDIFPMGSNEPIRVDFFDDDIESLRCFSAETQLSGDIVDSVDVLPAREIPLDADSTRSFREKYRERFEGQPSRSRVYREVSDGIAHGGIEYYLPLFFDSTASLIDYLPEGCVVLAPQGLESILGHTWAEIEERYELSRLDPERPILSPEETFNTPETILSGLAVSRQIRYSAQSLADHRNNHNLPTRMPPALKIEARYEDAAGALMQFLNSFDGRVLFTSDSAGRREQVFEMLAGRHLDLGRVDDWAAFSASKHRAGVAIAPIENGVLLPDAGIAIIGEQQLFGERVRQRSRRRRIERDPETIIRQLNDLEQGSPVVHAEYGIGRYLGLTTLEAGGIAAEFLELEYADGDKLYVPVHSLDATQALRLTTLRSIGWGAISGPRPESAPSARFAMLQPNFSTSMRGERHAWATASDGQRPTIAPLRVPFRSKLRTTRREPLMRYSKTWRRTNRWIVSYAATSVSAKPRLRCVPPLPPCMAANRLRFSFLQRCSHSSTARTSTIVSQNGRCVLKCCHDFNHQKQ